MDELIQYSSNAAPNTSNDVLNVHRRCAMSIAARGPLVKSYIQLTEIDDAGNYRANEFDSRCQFKIQNTLRSVSVAVVLNKVSSWILMVVIIEPGMAIDGLLSSCWNGIFSAAVTYIFTVTVYLPIAKYHQYKSFMTIVKTSLLVNYVGKLKP